MAQPVQIAESVTIPAAAVRDGTTLPVVIPVQMDRLGQSAIINQYLPLDRLVAHPQNYNAHPEQQIELLRTSLRQFGQPRSIVVQARDDNRFVIVAGHGVVQAARLENWREIRSDVLPADWPAEKVLAYLAADNELAKGADPDETQLALLLQQVHAFDTELAAVAAGSEDRLKKLLAQLRETGADPGPQIDQADELQQKWQVQPGQLWQLGEQRLICGDCTDVTVVTRLMAGERAILFATDPPYLVDYDGTNHPHAFNTPDKNKDWSGSYGDVHWDESGKNPDLYDKFIAVAVEIAIAPNAAWYCWHASRRQAMLEAIWEQHGAFVHQQIIWVKDRPVLTRSWYMWQHEPCFFGWVKGHQPPRCSEDYPRSVWEIPTVPPGTKTLHPTSKPTKVFEIPIQQHTVAGDLCYEPFSGSGSQIIACEKLGRKCRAIEIEPKYVAATLERWTVMTGQAPVLLSTGAPPDGPEMPDTSRSDS